MDWEGKINAAQPTCTASAATLAPGETVFSALIATSGLFVRQDYAAGLWPTVDRSSFLSWWKHKVPQPDVQRRSFKLNAEELGQIFANLQESQTRPEQCLRYVVALALVRARKWVFVEVVLQEPGASSVLVLQERVTGLSHRLPDPHMSPSEEQQVLDSLLNVVGHGGSQDQSLSAEGAPAADSSETIDGP